MLLGRGLENQHSIHCANDIIDRHRHIPNIPFVYWEVSLAKCLYKIVAIDLQPEMEIRPDLSK